MANEGEEKEEQVTRLKKCFTMNGHCQHTSFNRPAHYSFVRNRFQTTEQFTLENQFNSTRIIVSSISSSLLPNTYLDSRFTHQCKIRLISY